MAKSKRTMAKNTAWKWFSLFIRTRDAMSTMRQPDIGRCITCNKVVTVNGNDAGHFVSGRSDAVLFEEHNCHLQCAVCNRFKQGMWVEYEEALIKKYGEEEVARLKKLKHTVRSYTEQEFRDLAKIYKAKYQEAGELK